MSTCLGQNGVPFETIFRSSEFEEPRMQRRVDEIEIDEDFVEPEHGPALSREGDAAKGLSDEPEQLHNIVAFFLFGLINNFCYVVILSAAEHIFEDHSGAVLLAAATPGLVLKLLYGFGVHTIPYNIRIAFISLVPFSVFFIIASVESTAIRLSAIAFVSLVGGLGESSFLSLTATYSPKTIGAWSSGTGAAGICGAGFYFLLTVVCNLTPRTTLRLTSPIPLGLLLTYYFILRTPEKSSVTDARPIFLSPRAFVQKLPLLRALFLKLMLPLMLVYYFEYTINQGVLPVVDFVSIRRELTEETDVGSTDRTWDLYVTYQFLYQIGVFLSRSSISFVKIKNIWLLAILQLVNLVALLIVTAYELIQSAWIVFAMTLWEGLLGGAAYVNTFWNVSHQTPSSDREWALGVTTVSDTIGITLSGLTDAFLECALRGVRGLPCN